MKRSSLKQELRQERARIVELEAEKEGLSEQLRRARRHLTGAQDSLAAERSRRREMTSDDAQRWALRNEIVFVSRQVYEELRRHSADLPTGLLPVEPDPVPMVTERPKDLVVVRISVEADDGQRYGIQVPFSWRFIAWRFVLPAICKGQRDLLRVAPAGTDPKRLVWEVAHLDY